VTPIVMVMTASNMAIHSALVCGNAQTKYLPISDLMINEILTPDLPYKPAQNSASSYTYGPEPLGRRNAMPASFSVQATHDNHTLTVTAETAKEAFAKAVEWHVVERFIDISISDGSKGYSITEFSSTMALLEIARMVEAAAGPKARSEPFLDLG
jgi:hypothetical protein